MRAAASLAILLVGLGSAPPLLAGELVYRPVSPGFGGSPFNTDYVFGTAERAKSDPNSDDDRNRFGATRRSNLENFTQTLQARLLGQISDDIVTAIFGENAREEGRFTVADTVVEFKRLGDMINLVITDTLTGESTTIDVPVPRL